MSAAESPRPGLPAPLIFVAVAGLGCSAVLTQLTLLRELLAAFSGNELVFGLALGLWLLLTGLGAGLGRLANPLEAERPRSASLFLLGLAAIAIIPLLQIIAVRVFRDLVFLRGAAVGLTGTTLASAALLAPFCLSSGAMLTLASGLLARRDETNGVSRVYLADTLGSLAGGVLFSFGLVRWLDHFALLAVPAFLTLGLAFWIARRTRRPRAAGAVLLLAVALLITLAKVDVDGWSTARQYAGRIVCRANSPYGRLVVTNNSGQLTFFENGAPAFSTGQPERTEEAVHYALSQRPDARRVLLIGGGLTGTAREVLRWGVERITYVELDPLLLEVGERLLPGVLDDPRIETIATDGRRFVQRTTERFDLVILDLPDPATTQLNRYFTAEFFAEVKRVLAPGGVVSFGLGRYQNFVGKELAAVLATGHRTLATSFAQVRMIPGGRVFFLGSDAPLSLDIAATIEARGVATRFVTRHYLAAALAPDRIADLERAVAAPVELNTDFAPVLFLRNLRHWSSQFDRSNTELVFGALLAVIGLIYLVRLPTMPRLVCAAGFAASGLEVVLLLGFQVLYGALYQQVGLVVTVFMAGLAGGAWVTARKARLAAGGSTRMVRTLALGIALVAVPLPWVLGHLRALDAATASSFPGYAAILGLTFLLAALVGAQFAAASAAEAGAPPTAAARLFSADLVGAALGALLVSTLLIPLFGVTAVCLLIAGLNLAACGTTPRKLK